MLAAAAAVAGSAHACMLGGGSGKFRGLVRLSRGHGVA